MALNDIDEMLDTLRRIKSGDDVDDYMVYQILRFEAVLGLSRTFIKHRHILLPDSLVEITKKIKHIVEQLHECKTILHLRTLVSLLLKFIEGNTTLRCSYELRTSNLLEYMDCLGVNLNDVLMCLEFYESDNLNTILKQVMIVQKKMGFLRYLYGVKINGNIDHEKVEGLRTRIQFLFDNVGRFCLTFWVKEDMHLKNEVKNYIISEPPYLLCLVKLVKLELQQFFYGELNVSKFCHSKSFKNQKMPKDSPYHLRRLLTYLKNTKLENFPNDVSTRNVDEAIEFLLCFLDYEPCSFIDDKMLNEVLEKVGAIVGDILYVIQKLLPSSMIKDDTSKIDLCLIAIVKKIENLKARPEKYYIPLKSRFPTVGGLSFLDFLLRNLNEILESESSLSLMMKPHISILKKELSFLTSIFRDVAKLHHEHDFFKDRRRRTINLAYEVEVTIDSILAQCNPFWHIFCSLPTILKEMKHICEEVTEMWLKNRDVIPIVEQSTRSPTPYTDPVNDEEIVGFENDEEKIIRYLMEGTKDRDVIPIVGMGGKGKTTISKKVYRNSRIVSRFDVRAWCCISKIYNRRDLLQEIFNQLSGNKVDGVDELADQLSGNKVDEVDELADRLRKSLMGKRYLIVLDDMWDDMAWDDLRLSFPDSKNGSRIIVTTRLKIVGEHVQHHTDPYFLPFLKPEESDNLLQKKVFQKEGCPPELQDVSLEVAKRCKGLPLAVVLVAGIIKRKKTEASWWHEVKDSLHSYLGECEENSTLSTMQLSYDNLPDHIRPCMLYMGMFPEDEMVPVSKLISLWIAEGFVQSIESGSLEEAAYSYLMDLISSNLVMISKRTYNGKVKYCNIHDVVHHFCMEMGRKEKFMLAVQGHCSQFEPCDLKLRRLSFNVTDELSEIALLVPKARNPFHQQLRSLITTTDGEDFSDQNPIPFPQIIKLRLLRVLDLSCHILGRFSLTALNPLIHLKYLSVDTRDFDFNPESLLLNLETMIILSSCPVSVPAMFWKMEKLRHVEILGAEFDLKKNKQPIMEESCKLKNLRILKEVNFHTYDDVDVLFDRCPNIQELDIKVSGDSEGEICTFLSFNKLESLTLCSNRILSELHLPSNLKKLTLECPYVVNTAPLVAELPSLEYLKLKDYHYELDYWCLGDDIIFPQLKCLKLKRLDISRWEASEESFPMLETLVIDECVRIKNIPPCFEDISTLKKIKLIWCNNEVYASALKIKKEVEEIEGFDRIGIIIHGKLVREYEDLSQEESEEYEEESEEVEESEKVEKSEEFGNP